ncbi:hypothetical protein N752_22155 [Desulforamulus aquiferis]|nr:flagellin [Desulforamulus aquiferis]RYD03118.1 hypothetical protein N752_22155 [Desulforamulus aquiferis]
MAEVAVKINSVASISKVHANIHVNGTAQNLILESVTPGSKGQINVESKTIGITLDNIGLGALMTRTEDVQGIDIAGNINGEAAIGDGLTLKLHNGLEVTTYSVGTTGYILFLLGNDLDYINSNAVTKDGIVYLNGVSVAVEESDNINDLVNKFNAVGSQAGAKATFRFDTLLNQYVFEFTAFFSSQGDNSYIEVKSDGEAKIINDIAINSSGHGQSHLDFSPGTTDGVVVVENPNPVFLQVGPNTGNIIKIGINDMKTNALDIEDINVLTQIAAENAISKLDNAIKIVSGERSRLGAYENRLNHISKNASNYEICLTASNSKITDTDMAKEMIEMVKGNILSQAAQTMLAQANQFQQTVLQLLK